MAKKRIVWAVLTSFLLLVLTGLLCSNNQAAATLDEVKWSEVSIPTEGKTGDWVLASGSDVRHLTMAIDGTVYCYANPPGTGYTLFKSTDGGYSWSYTGSVQDAIVDIVTSPDDANTVYYATTANVSKSTDAGISFNPLPQNPGGAGNNNLEITSMDVTRLGSSNIIAVGTRDSDSSEFGGVYTLDEDDLVPRWADTNLGGYDVCDIAFSPDFPTDQQLVAVATDENDTSIITRISSTDWGQIVGSAIIENVVATTAAIAFPDDYDVQTEECAIFVGIDTDNDNGDVYKISGAWAPDSSVATDLDIDSTIMPSSVDVTTLAVSGDTATANLLAGSANSTQVYISTNGGTNWRKSSKEPTGQSRTCVIMAPDFNSHNRAYVATSGTESAFSSTLDGGITWNQVSLIDTKITSIIDLAVSCEYRQDNPRFMLTFNGDNSKHSLWRNLDDDTTWERILTSTLSNVDTIELVDLSPQYGNGNQVVFLAGTSNGNPAIWKSTDDGQTFIGTHTPLPVNVWAVVNDDSLFIGGYDGSSGMVYHTTDGGWSYSDGTGVGSQSLNSIAISPDYEQDKTILVGNTTGQVYYSTDNGVTFDSLGQQLPLSAGVGNVSVAFDPGFGSNQTIYAASDAKVTTGSEERIYRFIVDRSDAWESIDDTLTNNAVINQLLISADGILYAANSQSVDAANEEGGMERSLDPTYPLSQTFEAVIHDLDDGATLTGLWVCRNQLWSIDTTNTSLMTYADTLSEPVVLVSPVDAELGIDTTNIYLEWARLAGATQYKWQLDYETDFTSVPDEFEDSTDTNIVWLSELEPATTYYWRVRATQPVVSPWSDKWSFTTVLDVNIVACDLLNPKAGSNEVPIRPIFQWDAIAGAERYELLVSTDHSFASPLITKTGDYALPTTAWESNISLDYNTTYYWKVRAISADSYSTWSAIGAFTTDSLTPETPAREEPSLSELTQAESSPPESTQAEPAPPESPPVESSPTEALASESIIIEVPPLEIPPIQLTIPNWAVYSVFALLLTIVLLLVILLVLVVTTRRY